MKTTLEPTDQLMRRIKIRAAELNQKLKETIAQLRELGLRNAPRYEAPKNAPRPVKPEKHGPLTINDIEAAIADGRD